MKSKDTNKTETETEIEIGIEDRDVAKIRDEREKSKLNSIIEETRSHLKNIEQEKIPLKDIGDEIGHTTRAVKKAIIYHQRGGNDDIELTIYIRSGKVHDAAMLSEKAKNSNN